MSTATGAPDPEVLGRIDAELVRRAGPTRPRRRADAVAVDVDGRWLAWGIAAPPVVLGPLLAALWTVLDGAATVRDLTEDLAAVTGRRPDDVADHVAMAVLDLAAAGLVEGLGDLLDAWEGAPHRPQVEERIEVRDGVTTRVREVLLRRRDLDRLDERSLIERIDGDSCSGRMLQLDRAVPVVAVQVGARVLGVRVGDDDLRDRLEARDGADGPAGPLAAVVSTDALDGRPPRHHVYDGDGFLVDGPVDGDDALAALLGALVSHDPACFDPVHRAEQGPGLLLRAQVLVAGDLAVVAPRDALRRPRGLHRALRRAGIEPAPATLVLLDPEGDRVGLPRVRDLADLDRLDSAGGGDGPPIEWLALRGIWVPDDPTVEAHRSRSLARFLRTISPQAEADRAALVATFAGLDPARVLVTRDDHPSLAGLVGALRTFVAVPR